MNAVQRNTVKTTLTLLAVLLLLGPLAALHAADATGIAAGGGATIITERFAPGAALGERWRAPEGVAGTGDGVLRLRGRDRADAIARLRLPVRLEGEPVSICFTLKPPPESQRLDLSVGDAEAEQRYAVMLTTLAGYFANSGGFFDGTTVGTPGEALRSGVPNLVRLAIDPGAGTAVLEVNGREVLRQTALTARYSAKAIGEVGLQVFDDVVWEVSDLAVRTGSLEATPEERARGARADIESRILELERVPPGQRPPLNPENLSWIEETLKLCRGTRGLGVTGRPYPREARVWEIRQAVAEENLAALKLRRQVLETESAGQTPAPGLRDKLAAMEAKIAARTLTGPALAAAEAAWARVDAALAAVKVDAGWHVVKVHLLRDLVNRCRRAVHYRESAPPGGAEAAPLPDWSLVSGETSPLAAEMAEQVARQREWALDYGECFFGKAEQQAQGVGGEAAQALATRAETLATRLKQMESRRADLEKRVLAFLTVLNPDGSFADLGVPHRKPGAAIGADGRASDLLFAGLDSGTGAPGDMGKTQPLCYDMEDIVIHYGHSPMVARGRPGEIAPSRLEWAKAAAAEHGYTFKYPAIGVDSWWRPCPYRDVKLLPEGERDDPDLWLAGPDGKSTACPNIWNARLRALLGENLDAMARYCAQHIPAFLLYDKVMAEPAGLGYYHHPLGGYNPSVVNAFRGHLEKKFGTIAELNQAWDAAYADFAAITPPPSPFTNTDYRPDALHYEWHRFRADAFDDYHAACVRAIQAGDPGRPVATQLDGMTGTFLNATVPSHRHWKAFPAPMIDDHHNSWAGNYAALNLHYSLCLYAGKQPVETEYIWTFPRRFPVETEEDLRVTAELSVWRKMVWGRQLLNVFAPFDGWGYDNGTYDESVSVFHQPPAYGYGYGGAFVREAATALVVGKRRAREWWPILRETRIVKPRIAVVMPTVSIFNEYPFESLNQTYPAHQRAVLRWDKLLGERELDFRWVPEEAILDGDETLDGFRVVVLPHMAYFPDGLAGRLLAWVEAGGTLIAEGVPGVYDAYGREKPELMRAAFGDEVAWTYTGVRGRGTAWKWEFRLAPNPKTARVLATLKGRPALIAAARGRGRVLVGAEPFNEVVQKGVEMLKEGYAFAFSDDVSIVSRPDTDAAFTAAWHEAIRQAIEHPSVWSRRRQFELVERENDRGELFVFVINAQRAGTVTDTVFVPGVYAGVIDLGIGPRCKVPRVTLADGDRATAVSLRLAPGEATCLKLLK
jgi:hypothetical protein